ncbi:sulfatase [Paraglaciecola aquimarina]|uniref:Sulfatase n=1 Tax=Paraglaciecola algarum TaxID=3050085 RepID=A0ABS9D854_9ALTE|nr:sulfatase [Paraglaciecola sp. G1-23]MCF2948889.1 sulfatase [Paraglaciecola sp. G1-23]
MLNRRNFIIGSAGLLGTACTSQFEWLSKLKKEYPNVLMLAVDDLNNWVGALGGHPNAKTPNIDRLAQQGTTFTNAHASAPLCGPSRASIMTGLAPSTTGIYGHVNDDDIKSANQKAAQSIFLSEYFKQHGYYTAAVGKIFHQKVAKGSFDVFGGRVKAFGPYAPKALKWNNKGTNTDWGAYPEKDEQMPDYDTANWLVEHLNMQHDKPFFIAGGFLRPHVPWTVPQKWFDMHPIEDIQLPPYLKGDLDDVPEIAKRMTEFKMMPTTDWAIENGEWKYIVQAYLASVSFVDSCVGKVLDALENSEYADNTAVVLWGDHGYDVGEKNRFAKMALWETSTRTPLIIKPPKSQGKSVSSRPVSLLDLYPTLVKICGLPANPLTEGQDITPLLAKPDADWQHAAVSTFGPNNHAVKTDRYRYIRYEDGSEELYDHETDPNEWHNLADDKKYSTVKQSIYKYLPSENAPWSPVSQFRSNDYFNALTDKAVNPK